ncbi:MAG: glycine--tRNA ligase subunit beta [Caulobacteraceae bacterium]
MPQLLLELFSEDIPARMQAGAARDLERMARTHLAEGHLAFERARALAGPRRLTLVVDGLPTGQADRMQERRGPRIGASPGAIEGFLRSVDAGREALEERDGFIHARIATAGRPTAEIVAEMVPAIVRTFPWPKSMVSGETKLKWVRPLRRILCVFDSRVVAFDIDGVASGDIGEGHRFMGARRPFRARDFDEYREALAGHFVILDRAERRRRIAEGARALCAAKGLALVEDEGLLDEVCGMAEWPTPLLGTIDPAFLDLPPEVIRTSMRVHQRYFATRSADGVLAPHFVAIADIEASDGGALVSAGNSRVLSARLADARFFWDEDRVRPLEDRLSRLKGVTFHAKIGNLHERAERIARMSAAIAPFVGADATLAARAGRLAKADLTSGMVGEFPELQGVMGGYYAKAGGEPAAVALAIREHYRPQGPGDPAPNEPTSVAVALADKLDLLASFFAIGEKPTGSRDPFALRRAALGVIRIVLENGLRLPLKPFAGAGGDDLMAFLGDRLQGVLRDQGKRHDLVDAVFALGDDDLARVVARVEALSAFLSTNDGADLLAGYKRATNILQAETKKGPLPAGEPRPMAGAPAEEAGLIHALAKARPAAEAALAREDFAGAMAALAGLRAPVDAFFDKVLVNAPDSAQRDNRLALLMAVRRAMAATADFSRISGQVER